MTEKIEPFVGMPQCPFCCETENVAIGTDDEGPRPNWSMRCGGCGAFSPAFGSLVQVHRWMKDHTGKGSWEEYRTTEANR